MFVLNGTEENRRTRSFLNHGAVSEILETNPEMGPQNEEGKTVTQMHQSQRMWLNLVRLDKSLRSNFNKIDHMAFKLSFES